MASEMLGGIEAVRRFSRFYTRRIGVLEERFLGSDFSLTEGRILFELAHHESTTASELAKELGLNPGYLSRTLKKLEDRLLIERTTSSADARQNLLQLTEKGTQRFAELNGRSRSDVAAMLARLTMTEEKRLIGALQEVEALLGDGTPRRVPYILRPHQPGDIGWVIQKHGELYAREYGWDESMEAFVAEIAAKFIKEFDPKKERAWIAEKDGENVGCVFLVRESDAVAKLRLLLVDPKARGLGIGKRLVEECIKFARLKGYNKITLWTNDILTTARHIYEQTGFKMTAEERHFSFGHNLVGQNWELEL